MNLDLTTAELADYINAGIQKRIQQILDASADEGPSDQAFAAYIEANSTEQDRKRFEANQPGIVLELLEEILDNAWGIRGVLSERHLAISFRYNSARALHLPATYVLAEIRATEGHPLQEAKYLPADVARHFAVRLLEIERNPSLSLFSGPALVGVKPMDEPATSIFERILAGEQAALDRMKKYGKSAQVVQASLECLGGAQVANLVNAVRTLGLVEAFSDAATGRPTDFPHLLECSDWESTAALV